MTNPVTLANLTVGGGSVLGGDITQMVLAPDGVDVNNRNIKIDVAGYTAFSVEQMQEQVRAGGQVWIVAHGWNANYDNFRELAQSIVQASPNDVVLTIDWREASGSSFNQVGNVGNGGFYVAASWIGLVAEEVAQQLTAWQINPQSINLVGHSLGTFLAGEIAWQLKNQQGLGDTKSITVLDSAADPAKTSPIFPAPLLNRGRGYYWRRSDGTEGEPLDFREVSSFSRSLVGRSTAAGNLIYASEVDEAIIVDFGVPITDADAQHGDVYRLFHNLIDRQRPTQKLSDNLLGLDDYEPHTEFAQTLPYYPAKGVLIAESSANPSPEENSAPPKSPIDKVIPLGFYAKLQASPNLKADYRFYGTDGIDVLQVVELTSEQQLQIKERSTDKFRDIDDIKPASNSIEYFLGKGNDIVRAGAAQNWIYGEEGDDTLSGGGEADFLYGGEGADQLNGQAGNDVLRGNQGNDELHGGFGKDELYGGDGSDKLYGDEGDDRLRGGAGDDELYGGDGDDLLRGGDGNDLLVGVKFIDNLIPATAFPGLGEKDRLHGGAGADIFALGDDEYVYYLDPSGATYGMAEILDFDPTEGDKIRLKGNASDYFLYEGADDSAQFVGTYIVHKASIDLVWLQEATSAFKNKLTSVKQIIPELLDSLPQTNPTMRFGLNTFTDRKYTFSYRYPIYDDVIVGYNEGGTDMYGNPYEGGPIYEYQQVGVDSGTSTWTYPMYDYTFFPNLGTDFGFKKLQVEWLDDYFYSLDSLSEDGYGRKNIEDGKEAQLDALFTISKNVDAYKSWNFRDDAVRVVVVATNSLFHQAGDLAAEVAGIRPNDGDKWIDSDEDYVSIAQLRNALNSANIVPIFAVTETVKSAYTHLVAELGVGAVVDLSTNPEQVSTALAQSIARLAQHEIAFVRGQTNLNLSSDYFDYV